MASRKTQARGPIRRPAVVGAKPGAKPGAAGAGVVGEIDRQIVGKGIGLFDTYGQNCYVRVRRLDETTKVFRLEFRLAPDEATEETIQDLRGGGKYICERIEPDPVTGQLTITGTRTLELGGPVKPPGRLPLSMTRQDTTVASAAPVAASAAPAAGKPGADISFDDVMNMLKLRALAHDPPKGASTAELLTALTPIATAITGLVTALVQSREPVDVAAMVDKVTSAMQKNVAAQSPVSAFKEMTEAMGNVLDLKERAAGAGDDVDPLARMAIDNLPRLLDIVQDAMAQKRGGRVTADDVRKRLPAGQGAAAAPALPADAPGWQRFITKNKGFLLRAATAGKRAEIQAAFAFDMMPDDLRGSVRELMAAHIAEGGANAADQIIGVVPEFATYRAWVQDFVDTLAGQFFPEPEEPEATPAPAPTPGGES